MALASAADEAPDEGSTTADGAQGPEGGLEAALVAVQANVEGAGRLAGGVVRELKRARAAAAVGQPRDLRRALEAATDLARALTEQLAATRQGYHIDEADLLSSGAYTQELLAAAQGAGLAMFEEDDRLLCYPSLIRVLPGELALEVDKRRERRLRPSTVIELLRRAQQAGPRFKAETYLASLLRAYDFVAAQQGKRRGAVVRLLDVYDVLTLLPSQARDYSKQEFARDLYLLDQSRVMTVGATGRRLRWAASTGTKQAGILTTVARSGQQQRYWGVAFEGAGGD